MSGRETGSVLDRLVAQTRRQTSRRAAACPATELRERAAGTSPPRNFAEALRRPGLSVIAELKSRSPSKGPLTADYRPVELAGDYVRGGADAISVLTHEEGFGGSPEHLATVRASTTVPLLRKDFIVDEYQVLEARALGADAVLLIVAALEADQLATLLDLARSWGMEALVEVHDATELDVALAVGARVIGVNHRDLRTFAVDMTLTERLRHRVGGHRVLVSESGVHAAVDARALRAAGADAVLVGEALMRAADPAALVKELKQA